MCLELHMPLDVIYNMTDEDYQGLIATSHDMVDEHKGQASGQSYTRKPTGKELILYNKMNKGK